jgi:hypothetical protein
MTPSEAFEANLTQGGDSCVFRAKILGTATLTSTPSVVLAISPPNLGARIAAAGQLFSDYRVKSLLVKFIDTASGTGSSGLSALGFLDDASGAEGDAPTSLGGVVELRCSATSLFNTTIPSNLFYKPTNPRMWYKTYAGSSGSDQRLVVPAILFGAAAANTVSYEMDIEVVFKGAVDLSSS